MSGLYKLESYDKTAVSKIIEHISKQGGTCLVLGYAILTDHVFRAESCLDLVPYVSSITDHLSDVDRHYWHQFSVSAA